jgi:tetratricopeptide (TPR) repeat protein
MGRYKEAIAAYEKARNLDSQKAAVFIAIGNSQYRLGENYLAVTAYQQAIKREKDNPETWKSLGNSWFNLGKYDEAIKAYDESLLYRSDDREVQAQKQLAETRLKKLQESSQPQVTPSPTVNEGRRQEAEGRRQF